MTYDCQQRQMNSRISLVSAHESRSCRKIESDLAEEDVLEIKRVQETTVS